MRGKSIDLNHFYAVPPSTLYVDSLRRPAESVEPRHTMAVGACWFKEEQSEVTARPVPPRSARTTASTGPQGTLQASRLLLNCGIAPVR